MYACAPHHVVPIETREGARSLDTELQINVSHWVGAGNQTRDLCKNSKCSQPLSHQEQQCKNI